MLETQLSFMYYEKQWFCLWGFFGLFFFFENLDTQKHAGDSHEKVADSHEKEMQHLLSAAKKWH